MAGKGLSLDRLASFLAVVEAGGIARAAPGQPVRQSQLSRQVGELERALGVALFERGTQGPRVPSPAGARLACLARDFHRGLDDVSRADAGPLAIALGAGDSAIHWLIAPIARELPDVQVDVGARSTAEIVAELADGTIDAGVVRLSDAPSGGLKATRIGTLEYALFSPRGEHRPPLAVATGEPALAPLLASLGPARLRCETFPQVAAAVRAGFAGVLPTIARWYLGDVKRGPVLTASALGLAWRARLDDVRPALVPVRRRLADLLRSVLAKRA
ncbi:MAG TPA: LysR family transcriptional regulator [Polyangia bacterium]|jgi:DNA-binding transcriptional LysR family regulator|nr:LysR family transcriptional regulator [Polyangia bacterium]